MITRSPHPGIIKEIAYFTEDRGWVDLGRVVAPTIFIPDQDFGHDLAMYELLDPVLASAWTLSFEIQPRSLAFGHIPDWRDLFLGMPKTIDCLKHVIDWWRYAGVPSDSGIHLSYPEYMLMKTITDDRGRKLYLNDRDFNTIFSNPRAKLHFKVG